MQWQLKTGRTHQIRVHAKHMHHPLLSDEAYGGAGGTAVNVIGQGKSMRRAYYSHDPHPSPHEAGQSWA